MTTLATGDIALIGYSADTAGKSFAFVLLRDVDASTSINFTDNGWFASGGFRANEGTTTWTAPAGGATAGTVITISGLTGQLNPSVSGDQFLAYQGTASSPTFLYALDFADGNTSFAGDATNSNTSAIPTGLTAGSTALAFGADNGAYTGPLTGSVESLRAAISNSANWTLDDANPVSYAPGFTISAGSTVRVGDVTVSEGAAGTTVMEFLVTRTGTGAFSVNYATANSSATAGSDYVATSGTLNFGANETQKVVQVIVNGDTVTEGNETLFLNLTSATGGVTIADAQGVGTITNDDGLTITKISQVQGSGAASGMQGQTVTIEAIVTGDFQNNDGDTARNLGGFFVQEEVGDWDGNSLTSEGLFIFGGTTNVNPGDVVRVTGVISEFNGLTELTATNISVVQAGAVSDVSTLTTDISLPGTNLESYEGMMVRIPQTLVVTDQQDLERLGEVKLYASEGDGLGGLIDEAPDGRPYTFTQTNDPSVSGWSQFQTNVAARTIIYDDGLNGTWQGIQSPDGGVYSTATAIQGGDTITNLEGVLDFGFSAYRLRSVENGQNDFADSNPHDATPPVVDGSLTVASFNVLNFFVTLNNGGSTDNGQEPRGANTTVEFNRQLEKLLDTLITLDADVLGLVEIENDFTTPTSAEFLNGGPAVRAQLYMEAGNAIGFLVEQLNLRLGDNVYSWVDPGPDHLGTDAIAVGFIYKNDVVGIADGTTAAVDFNAVNNRPTVAVTFEQLSNGAEFTAVVNHFKSKGSGTGANADQNDGQARSNLDRVEQAQRLDQWLDTNPTGTDDTDYVLLGDFNAYYQEDPIDVLRAAGYQIPFDQTATSYVFDGWLGTLDYALVNGSLAGQVAGSGHWHINADEAPALDYNISVENAPAGYVRPSSWYNGDTSHRTSDHDVTLIGLNLTPANVGPVAVADTAAVSEDASVTIDVLANDTDANAGDTKTILSVSATASGATVQIVGGKVVYTADPDAFDLLGVGQTATDSFTYLMKDAAGLTSSATVQVTVGGVADAAPRTGGAGNESMAGTGSEDRIDGGAGNDTVTGDTGADTVLGGNGDDLVQGGTGIDNVSGGVGNDTLEGGAGDDVLSGGRNNDVFVFGAGFGDDIITDFKVVEDEIRFQGAGFTDFADMLAHASQVGANVLISNAAGDSLQLNNIQLSSLQSADFLFV